MNKRKSNKINSIVWFVSTLSQSGGGERLLFEGASFFINRGIRVKVLTLETAKRDLFNNRYDNIDTVYYGMSNSYNNILEFFKKLHFTRKTIKLINPDYIIVQSENNAIFINLALVFIKIPIALFIFGQMFQFKNDLTKYAFIFKKQFSLIRNSMEGYKKENPATKHIISLKKRLGNEIIAFMRYYFVKKTSPIFVLSRQVKWEVQKLYNKKAHVFKGAVPLEILNYKENKKIRNKFGLPDGPMFFSLSRLVPKKNVELCIHSFKAISTKNSTAFLVIGGTGFHKKYLEELVDNLGMKNKVYFIGYIPDIDLWDYYSMCDVFLQLDVADFNIVFYEALCLGKKIILSVDTEIDSWLSNKENVVMVKPNINSVINAMERIISENLTPPLKIKKQLLKQYTWEYNYSKVLQLLSSNA